MNAAQLTELYCNNGLFAKIIDTPAEAATLRGLSITCKKNIAERVSAELEYLNWDDTAATAIKWARLYGGSIAVLHVNDGENHDKPINSGTLKSVDNITVYDCRHVQPLYNDFSEITAFQIRDQEHVFIVDKSRCLMFRNSIMPENATEEMFKLWGVPEYEHMTAELEQAEKVGSDSIRLLQQAVQAVYKVQGLSDMLATENGETQVLKMLEVLNITRGVYNTAVIDKKDSFNFKSINMVNVSEAVKAAHTILSTVSGIPPHILWGEREKHGLNNYIVQDGHRTYNATGREIWSKYIKKLQEQHIRGNTKMLVNLILTALYNRGEIKEKPKFTIVFPPVYSDRKQTDAELKRVQAQLIRAQTLQTLRDICN